MSAPEKHALLSPSSAHRWLNCPPSARLTESMPDSAGEAAREGRLAHAIAALYLQKRFTALIRPGKFRSELNKLKADPLYKPEMRAHVETYSDLVNEIANTFPSIPYIAVEQEVRYDAYVPEGSGTADCIILGRNGELHIVDFKYGANPNNRVDAEMNPQMALYALGAMARYQVLHTIQRVSMTVCQPRLTNTATFSLSADDLRQWGESIKETARLAWEGKGEFREGSWCVFCKAKAQCSIRAYAYTTLEDFGFRSPHLLTPSEIGDVLTRGNRLASWLKDVEGYALTACLDGEDIPGWKAVEGRSNRAFSDLDKAFDAARDAGIEDALLYERRPITLTALENIMGPKPFQETVGPFVVKPQGKPTLAPAEDPRTPFARSSAQEDFQEVVHHG